MMTDLDELRSTLIATVDRARPSFALPLGGAVTVRAPLRIDLAGGWTDTPPYCIDCGGTVVNAAILLDATPPVMLSARRTSELYIQLHCWDTDATDLISSHADLARYDQIGSEFSVARAALSMAGLAPEFSEGPTLALPIMIDQMGGGLGISFGCAAPHGSGLGASSILAGAMLLAVNRMFGLGWDTCDVLSRTMVIEQMMTTGGGWQDQYGGLLPGVKLLTSLRGIDQSVCATPLPSAWLQALIDDDRLLLYNTGITRHACSILKGIAHDAAHRNHHQHGILQQIAANSDGMADAIRAEDEAAFGASLSRAWSLNLQLDARAYPPTMAGLIDRIEPYSAGHKLLGAGGGGYLLILAKDADAAAALVDDLPSDSHRGFVEWSIARHGATITTSEEVRLGC